MKKTAIYPLFDLNTDIDSPMRLEKGIYISTNEIDLEKVLQINLSKEDRHQLKTAHYCLLIDSNKYKPEQVSIVFIISCRLLKRTRVFIRYRVDEMIKVLKIRDDYPYVTSDDVTSTINKAEFRTVSKIFSGLNSFKAISTRTSNAVYFIGLAYRSRKWIESLIFHVCALETLTSSSDNERGVTEKFSTRINNFVGYDKEQLRRIYNIRSELIHGRYKTDSKEETLVLLRIAEEACRKVFIKILLDNSNLESFSNDEDRMKLFEK